MKLYQIYIVAIVIGVLALIVGILYVSNILGYHPIRAYSGLGIGVILLIVEGWIHQW
jgi:hypothetical protein